MADPTSIAFLCASMALLALGSFILYDSLTKLLVFEHPPIGLVKPVGDTPVWLGWPMLAALAWSAPPAVFLGRAKQPLARELHDKVLVADAEMNRADWLTAGAAMAGVVGIGFGLWWADGVAATIISLDITHDGYKNLKVAIADLMDKEPTVVDHSRADPLPLWVRNELMLLGWVKDAEVRLREEGHVYFGGGVRGPGRRPGPGRAPPVGQPAPARPGLAAARAGHHAGARDPAARASRRRALSHGLRE